MNKAAISKISTYAYEFFMVKRPVHTLRIVLHNPFHSTKESYDINRIVCSLNDIWILLNKNLYYASSTTLSKNFQQGFIVSFPYFSICFSYTEKINKF